MKSTYLLSTICICIFLQFENPLSGQRTVSNNNNNKWVTSSPENEGLDPNTINTVLERAKQFDHLHAVLVIRNNRLVAERYYNGNGPNDLYHIRSITKNIVSALTGIAIDEELIKTPLQSIAPDYPNWINGPKKEITIQHLLNMTSGLSWQESDEINDLLDQKIKSPISYLLKKKLDNPPGTTFNYNSLSPHILTDIIEMESQQSISSYTEERLFHPLGIERYKWQKDPRDNEWGGLGIKLSARDLAKFGQLYLDQGEWEGQRIVPVDWVKQSQLGQINTNFTNTSYSNYWWVSENFQTPLYYGSGYGGQALMVLPEKNMVIVALQKYNVSQEQHNKQWNTFIQEVFLPIINAINI